MPGIVTANQLVAFTLASILSFHGLRKKSLSPSGAATAWVVGYLMFSPPLHAFGITLIVFYLTGSRATKHGKERKAQLEEGFQDAGYRSGWQVLCNSFTALVATLAWTALFVPSSLPSSILGVQASQPYKADEWCAIQGGYSRSLLFVALGHFGTCLGDTLASELGILSKSRPILITTFKPVPPGTNGGMSAWGTSCSLFGGLFMGIIMAISLLVENSACRASAGRLIGECVLAGAASGLFGSLLDSLLGATLQKTRYDGKRILQDDSRAEGQVISGIGLLSNNQVNFVSSLVIGVVLGVLA